MGSTTYDDRGRSTPSRSTPVQWPCPISIQTTTFITRSITTKGISNDIKKNYQKVLRNEEFDRINELTREFSDLIDDDTPVNLLDIPDKVFYDYSFQKRYFDDKDKITLYYALTNSTKRRYNISKIPAYSLFAIIFSFLVRIMHLPRMIKLKYFKGKGKQNYT